VLAAADGAGDGAAPPVDMVGGVVCCIRSPARDVPRFKDYPGYFVIDKNPRPRDQVPNSGLSTVMKVKTF
jgi:hypothetical protein